MYVYVCINRTPSYVKYYADKSKIFIARQLMQCEEMGKPKS